MELKAVYPRSESIGLVTALFRPRQPFRPARQIERLSVPVEKHGGRFGIPANSGSVRAASVKCTGSQPISRARLRYTRAPSALAINCEPRHIPSSGTFAFSASSISASSRRHLRVVRRHGTAQNDHRFVRDRRRTGRRGRDERYSAAGRAAAKCPRCSNRSWRRTKTDMSWKNWQPLPSLFTLYLSAGVS